MRQRNSQRNYYLCEVCFITCSSDHGKSNLDQGKDNVWATVVTRVCAELSIHQIIHNCVEGFRSKQLVNCGLKWGRFWNDQNSEFLNCLFFFSPGCPSCSRHKSCQHPEVPHRCWRTSSQPGEWSRWTTTLSLTLGSQYPGQRTAAMAAQNPGSSTAHSSSSGPPAHSPFTRISWSQALQALRWMCLWLPN